MAGEEPFQAASSGLRFNVARGLVQTSEVLQTSEVWVGRSA